jgi:hypothetical protein
VFLYCGEFLPFCGGKKKEKVLTTSTMEFFENNYPNFPDFDFFFK